MTIPIVNCPSIQEILHSTLSLGEKTDAVYSTINIIDRTHTDSYLPSRPNKAQLKEAIKEWELVNLEA